MDLLLMNTSSGLVPLYDDDYDEKQRLRLGQVYKAKISVPRNIALHRKYFSMIRCAWDLLNPAVRNHFHNDLNTFRKTVEMAAGYCETAYNLKTKEWMQYPKSIAFDKMRGDEFETLYTNVREVLFSVFLRHLTLEEFEQSLLNY